MQTSSTPGSDAGIQYEVLRRNTLLATPLVLLVPVAFAVVLSQLGADLNWSTLGFGALGWVGALFLRGPLAAILSQTMRDEEKVKTIIVASSGPIEEGVRLLLLLWIGRSFSNAAAIGVGWAAIEVIYTTITGFITLSLMRRTDPEAMQARALLESQGMIRETGPWLGVVERIGATALHIGFTFFIAWRPIAVIGTAIVHSVTNLTLIRSFKERPIATELALLIAGLTVLAAGVTLVR